jgi:hypothetical protein
MGYEESNEETKTLATESPRMQKGGRKSNEKGDRTKTVRESNRDEKKKSRRNPRERFRGATWQTTHHQHRSSPANQASSRPLSSHALDEGPHPHISIPYPISPHLHPHLLHLMRLHQDDRRRTCSELYAPSQAGIRSMSIHRRLSSLALTSWYSCSPRS